jgi:hypothetical protein
MLLCTLTVKPVIISAYFSGAHPDWHDKYGKAFALTADSGKTLWETDVYHNVDCLYDTVIYGYTNALLHTGLFAASVFTGDTIYAKGGSSFKISANDKYLFTRGYGGRTNFINRLTGVSIGTSNFSAVPVPSGGGIGSGCGYISLANGYGYCGFGTGVYTSNSTYNPPGGIQRGDYAQGIYAFEIPKNNETSLKVVWYYKTASNICSTPAIANGKLYYTTNQEGAIYCFENER